MTPIAIFPGSFDPITLGHLDIIQRASRVFEKVIVAIGRNTAKQNFFTLQERVTLVTLAAQHLKNVTVLDFDGLAIDFALEQHAQVILRGIRNSGDLDNEISLAHMNTILAADINTLFIAPSAQHVFISSTLVREIIKLKGDIKPFVPSSVYDYIRNHPDVASHY